MYIKRYATLSHETGTQVIARSTGLSKLFVQVESEKTKI